MLNFPDNLYLFKEKAQEAISIIKNFFPPNYFIEGDEDNYNTVVSAGKIDRITTKFFLHGCYKPDENKYRIKLSFMIIVFQWDSSTEDGFIIEKNMMRIQVLCKEGNIMSKSKKCLYDELVPDSLTLKETLERDIIPTYLLSNLNDYHDYD